MTILITLMETLHNEVTMQSVIISAQPTNGNQSERGRHNLFLSGVVTAGGNERSEDVSSSSYEIKLIIKSCLEAPQRGWAGRITNITNIWLIENVLKQQIFSQCQQETLYSIKVWIIDSEIQMTCDSYRSEYLHLRVNLPVDFKSFKGSDNHIVVISSWKYPPSSSILRFHFSLCSFCTQIIKLFVWLSWIA